MGESEGLVEVSGENEDSELDDLALGAHPSNGSACSGLKQEETGLSAGGEAKTDNSNEPVLDETRKCTKWSEAFKSPSDGVFFSPSQDMNKPDSIHGLGQSFC